MSERISLAELSADTKIQKIRERIRRYFPSEGAKIIWQKASPNRIESLDRRFSVERLGSGDATRYTAKMKLTVIGHRLLTAREAKEICERYAMTPEVKVGSPPGAPATADATPTPTADPPVSRTPQPAVGAPIGNPPAAPAGAPIPPRSQPRPQPRAAGTFMSMEAQEAEIFKRWEAPAPTEGKEA